MRTDWKGTAVTKRKKQGCLTGLATALTAVLKFLVNALVTLIKATYQLVAKLVRFLNSHYVQLKSGKRISWLVITGSATVLAILSYCGLSAASTQMRNAGLLPTYTPTVTATSTNTATPMPTATATSTNTATPLPTEISEPTATLTQTPTDTPRPTKPPTATSAPLPAGYATQGANLRAGPGTNYDIAGSLAAGDEFSIVGQTADGEWYQIELASGETAWIASFLVSTEAGAIPIVQPDTIPATPTPVPATNTPTATNTPVATDTPVPAVADVVISDSYNKSYDEYLQLTNRGTAVQDMSGWSVTGSKGEDRYTFPDGYVLGPGESVKLYSGSNGVDAWPTSIYWTTDNVWNNGGETAFLWNREGSEVSRYRW